MSKPAWARRRPPHTQDVDAIVKKFRTDVEQTLAKIAEHDHADRGGKQQPNGSYSYWGWNKYAPELPSDQAILAYLHSRRIIRRIGVSGHGVFYQNRDRMVLRGVFEDRPYRAPRPKKFRRKA